jgi:hypothetical protein
VGNVTMGMAFGMESEDRDLFKFNSFSQFAFNGFWNFVGKFGVGR